jgi:hypothetical protein
LEDLLVCGAEEGARKRCVFPGPLHGVVEGLALARRAFVEEVHVVGGVQKVDPTVGFHDPVLSKGFSYKELNQKFYFLELVFLAVHFFVGLDEEAVRIDGVVRVELEMKIFWARDV